MAVKIALSPKKSKSLKLKRELEKIFSRMEGLISFDGSGADLIREVRRKTAHG